MFQVRSMVAFLRCVGHLGLSCMRGLNDPGVALGSGFVHSVLGAVFPSWEEAKADTAVNERIGSQEAVEEPIKFNAENNEDVEFWICCDATKETKRKLKIDFPNAKLACSFEEVFDNICAIHKTTSQTPLGAIVELLFLL